MSDNDKRDQAELNQAKQDVFDQVPGMPIFIRLRVFRLMADQGLSVEQAVAVVHDMIQLYETGRDMGESQTLYARIPEGWPRSAGRPVHLYKIWDMLIMEFEVKGEPGEYRYTAQAGRDNHWGKPRKDMHAAIADALGFKHDGDMSTAGEYIIRMLDIQED